MVAGSWVLVQTVVVLEEELELVLEQVLVEVDQLLELRLVLVLVRGC